MSVGITGTLVISANSTSSGQASALMTPPPATISGRAEALSIASAFSICASDAYADIPRTGPRVTLRHVRCALDVAGQHVLDAAAALQRRVQGIDGRARHSERLLDAFLFHDADGCVGCGHSGHWGLLAIRRK